jgi:hypothetical protein
MLLAVGVYEHFGIIGLIALAAIGAFRLSRGRWH